MAHPEGRRRQDRGPPEGLFATRWPGPALVRPLHNQAPTAIYRSRRPASAEVKWLKRLIAAAETGKRPNLRNKTENPLHEPRTSTKHQTECY